MGIGVGIVLLLIGLVLVTGVLNVNLGSVDEHGLGWIFIIVGALAIILALVLNAQRQRRTTVVDDRRGPPVV
jgi:tellurite resistance protein TehA-like permease